jgi:hypothetical protein
MRHPLSLYVQATTTANPGYVDLFDRSEHRPRERQLFGFVRRFLRPATPKRIASTTPAA